MEKLEMELFSAIVDGDPDKAVSAATKFVELGYDAQRLVTEILVPAMRRVGELFERYYREALRLAEEGDTRQAGEKIWEAATAL